MTVASSGVDHAVLGAMPRRTTGLVAFSAAMFAWVILALQPCCEALATAISHGHADAKHVHAPAHQAGEHFRDATAEGQHAHCPPLSLATIDSAATQAALTFVGLERELDIYQLVPVSRAAAWLVPTRNAHAPRSPPAASGALTYLRTQRFRE